MNSSFQTPLILRPQIASEEHRLQGRDRIRVRALDALLGQISEIAPTTSRMIASEPVPSHRGVLGFMIKAALHVLHIFGAR